MITVTNNNGVVTVTGLAETVTITGFEANDRIVINGLGGDDVIEASGLSGMLLTANGGDGDDVLIGSPGNDILTGGTGDDVLIGGGGAGHRSTAARATTSVFNAATPAPHAAGSPCSASSWRRASSPAGGARAGRRSPIRPRTSRRCWRSRTPEPQTTSPGARA